MSHDEFRSELRGALDEQRPGEISDDVWDWLSRGIRELDQERASKETGSSTWHLPSPISHLAVVAERSIPRSQDRDGAAVLADLLLKCSRDHAGPLQQQIEDAEGPLPLLGLRVFELGVQDLEGAGEVEAQAADGLG